MGWLLEERLSATYGRRSAPVNVQISRRGFLLNRRATCSRGIRILEAEESGLGIRARDSPALIAHVRGADACMEWRASSRAPSGRWRSAPKRGDVDSVRR